MKKLFLTFFLSFTLLTTSNAIGCISSYLVQQNNIELGYANDLADCPVGPNQEIHKDCYNDVTDHYNLVSALNPTILIACCANTLFC